MGICPLIELEEPYEPNDLNLDVEELLPSLPVEETAKHNKAYDRSLFLFLSIQILTDYTHDTVGMSVRTIYIMECHVIIIT